MGPSRKGEEQRRRRLGVGRRPAEPKGLVRGGHEQAKDEGEVKAPGSLSGVLEPPGMSLGQWANSKGEPWLHL